MVEGGRKLLKKGVAQISLSGTRQESRNSQKRKRLFEGCAPHRVPRLPAGGNNHTATDSDVVFSLLLACIWYSRTSLLLLLCAGSILARRPAFNYSYTLGAPCHWPCRLRWRLVALASWGVFVDSDTL